MAAVKPAIVRYVSDHKPITYADLSIERSLEAPFSRLSMRTHDSLRQNEQIEVLYAGAIRFRGYLEIDDGDRMRGYAASARSITSQLNLFDATGSESFHKTTIRTVAIALANEADVIVADCPDLPVNVFRMQRGESYRVALQRLAEAKQVTVTDNASGQLVLFSIASISPSQTWRAGSGTVTEPIKRRRDFSDWRSEIYCRGNRIIVDSDIGSGDEADVGLEENTAFTRPSRRVLGNKAASSSADAINLIDWEAKKQLARVAAITIVHGAWAADTGDILRVVDRSQGIDDDMVVAGIRADLPQRRFEYAMAFPAVYQPLAKTSAAIAKAQEWT